MISEEKVRLMTDAALFEKKNRSMLKDYKYRRRDFISISTLRVWIVFLLTYGIFMILAILHAAGMGEQLIVSGKQFYPLLLEWAGAALLLSLLLVLICRSYYKKRYIQTVVKVYQFQKLLERLDHYYEERNSNDDNDFTGLAPEDQ